MDIRKSKHRIPGLCWTVSYWKNNRAAAHDENWDKMEIAMFGGHPKFEFYPAERTKAQDLVAALTYAHAHGKRVRSSEITKLLEL